MSDKLFPNKYQECIFYDWIHDTVWIHSIGNKNDRIGIAISRFFNRRCVAMGNDWVMRGTSTW